MVQPAPAGPLDDVEFNAAQASVPLPGSGDADSGLQQLLQNDTLFVVRYVLDLTWCRDY